MLYPMHAPEPLCKVARTLSKVDTVNTASMITAAKVHMLPSDSKDNRAPILKRAEIVQIMRVLGWLTRQK